MSDFDDTVVTEQLRAGSILEAVRIRKIGYGYRMEYEDFGEKFWPLLGDRIYGETDHHVTKIIFEKAADMHEDPDVQKILREGVESGWRCGQTKLFMKDNARYAIEGALHKLQSQMSTKV